jgi:hypothetical protein
MSLSHLRQCSQAASILSVLLSQSSAMPQRASARQPSMIVLCVASSSVSRCSAAVAAVSCSAVGEPV